MEKTWTKPRHNLDIDIDIDIDIDNILFPKENNISGVMSAGRKQGERGLKRSRDRSMGRISKKKGNREGSGIGLRRRLPYIIVPAGTSAVRRSLLLLRK